MALACSPRRSENQLLESGVTYRHWQNPSAVTHAGGVPSPKSAFTNPNSNDFSLVPAPRLSDVVTGAFVSGSKTAQQAREKLAAAERTPLPFRDLMKIDDDDDGSFHSDSDTSPECNR